MKNTTHKTKIKYICNNLILNEFHQHRTKMNFVTFFLLLFLIRVLKRKFIVRNIIIVEISVYSVTKMHFQEFKCA